MPSINPTQFLASANAQHAITEAKGYAQEYVTRMAISKTIDALLQEEVNARLQSGRPLVSDIAFGAEHAEVIVEAARKAATDAGAPFAGSGGAADLVGHTTAHSARQIANQHGRYVKPGVSYIDAQQLTFHDQPPSVSVRPVFTPAYQKRMLKLVTDHVASQAASDPDLASALDADRLRAAAERFGGSHTRRRRHGGTF